MDNTFYMAKDISKKCGVSQSKLLYKWRRYRLKNTLGFNNFQINLLLQEWKVNRNVNTDCMA